MLACATHDTLLPAIIVKATELVARVTDLLSFSAVYFRVNELLQDPRSSAQDLGVVISHEPGRAQEFPLETALVHLANSAANSVEPGRNILDCRPMRDAQAWQLTGLSEDDLERALADAKDQFLDVIRIISPSEPLL
jgi:hypothetical protein